jgi:hypothetical protein
MTDIEWADPPPKAKAGPKGGKWQIFTNALRANPGKWAKAPGVYQTTSTSSGLARRFPDIEWTARVLEHGGYHIYARAKEL